MQKQKFMVKVGFIPHKMTADEIFTQVLTDFKTHREHPWRNIPLTELRRLCDHPEFPREYAIKIQYVILEHFYYAVCSGTHLSHTEVELANACSAALPDDRKECHELKNRYTEAYLHTAPKAGK